MRCSESVGARKDCHRRRQLVPSSVCFWGRVGTPLNLAHGGDVRPGGESLWSTLESPVLGPVVCEDGCLSPRKGPFRYRGISSDSVPNDG